MMGFFNSHWKEIIKSFVLVFSLSMVAVGYCENNDKMVAYFSYLVALTLGSFIP